MSKGDKLRFSKFSNEGYKSYKLTSASRSAQDWQIGRHYLAGNFYIPHWKILKISIYHLKTSILVAGINTVLTRYIVALET